ncbi:MAG: Do family serine endopeptidase, partial [Alphaproteobacteria bacterium]
MPDNLTKATGHPAGRQLRGRAARLAVVALVGSAVALGSMGYLNRSTALTPSRASATETAPVSFADVADKVRPAVVAIQVTGTVDPAVESFDPRPFDEFFERFFGDDSERRFREFRERMPRRRAGVGSGFIVDADGFIVTNNHVIEDADEITVTLANGDSFEAELMGADPKTDLALVRIEADETLPFVRFGDSDETRVGDWVVAVGSPFGLDHSVTVGVVSAKDRSIGSGPYDSFLQIDAPINRGNSGGPAFNLDSEVIGVNSAIFSPSGGNIGIGFAIPANIAEDVVTQLRERGEVRRGWLGVSIQAVTEDIARSLDMDESTGAIVASVVPGSPADDAGIEAGDVIIAVGAADVASVRDLPRLVAMLEAGERAEIVVLRDGREKTLD